MKKSIYFFAAVITLLLTTTLQAQELPLKPRPDAFAPEVGQPEPKAFNMASSVDEMRQWDRYPTYNTYLSMMAQWAAAFPQLCHVDTIGTSVQGRLILCMVIRGESSYQNVHPEFFYSSTMHGDEVTGYVMMLRLIDTLLHGYGTNTQYTELINTVDIYINPLANPDGTYFYSNNTIQGSMRYNANYVDLNRNFPDPFGTDPLDPQQPENTAMINYVSNHNFRMSANLHGGSEVMNYPWDSFTSLENPHPNSDWWQEVCKRFVDTSRTYNNNHFRDVTSSGYIAGGDWYVIPNGRQDYMNYYHNCLEMTMELSTDKKLNSDELPEYWRFLQHSLVNYIEEVRHLNNGTQGIGVADQRPLKVYPNPTRDKLLLSEAPTHEVQVFNMQGQRVLLLPTGTRLVDLSTLPGGIYMLRSGSHTAKVVKQ